MGLSLNLDLNVRLLSRSSSHAKDKCVGLVTIANVVLLELDSGVEGVHQTHSVEFGLDTLESGTEEGVGLVDWDHQRQPHVRDVGV